MPKIQANGSKSIIKYMPDLVKLMMTADDLNWSIDKGVVDGPPEKGWKTNVYDGNMTITIQMYHKKHDMRPEDGYFK